MRIPFLFKLGREAPTEFRNGQWVANEANYLFKITRVDRHVHPYCGNYSRHDAKDLFAMPDVKIVATSKVEHVEYLKLEHSDRRVWMEKTKVENFIVPASRAGQDLVPLIEQFAYKSAL